MTKSRRIRGRKPKSAIKELFKDKKFLLLISIPIIIVASLFVVGFNPFGDMYITGNDIIKNFSIDSFDGNLVSSGGSTEDGNLKAEVGAFWKITQEDIEVLNTYDTEDGYRYLLFAITAKNSFNFYTTISLNEACESLATEKESFLLGTYTHREFWGFELYSWDQYMYWDHYNFENLREYNLENNEFSGDYKFTFDINPSVLPDFFTDAEGNTFTTEYDYIAVNGIYVDSNIVGDLSGVTPSFYNLEPAVYTAQTTLDYNKEAIGPTETAAGVVMNWDPRISISNPYVTEQIQEGIIPHSVGASLNPKTRFGDNIWNPQERYESQVDCSFFYNIGSLSPVVRKYSATLTYYEQELITREFFPVTGIEYNRDYIHQETRDVGLQVVNRFIHSELAIRFIVWSKFNITSLDTSEPELQLPSELDEGDIFGILPDSGSGASFIAKNPLIIWIIIIIVIVCVSAAGLFIFIKLGIPLILNKQKKGGKSNKGVAEVKVSKKGANIRF